MILNLFGGNFDISSPFTIEPEEPDLTSIGGGAFFTNGVKLLNTSFHTGGKAKFGRFTIGDNTVVLDSYVLETGTSLDNGTLVGYMSLVTAINENKRGHLLLVNTLLIIP